MASTYDIITELEDMRDSAQNALENLESAAGFLDQRAEDVEDGVVWDRGDKETVLGQLQSAASTLQGPKTTLDIIGMIGELQSEVQGMEAGEVEA